VPTYENRKDCPVATEILNFPLASDNVDFWVSTTTMVTPSIGLDALSNTVPVMIRDCAYPLLISSIRKEQISNNFLIDFDLVYFGLLGFI
jgi:hypothetical protein